MNLPNRFLDQCDQIIKWEPQDSLVLSFVVWDTDNYHWWSRQLHGFFLGNFLLVNPQWPQPVASFFGSHAHLSILFLWRQYLNRLSGHKHSNTLIINWLEFEGQVGNYVIFPQVPSSHCNLLQPLLSLVVSSPININILYNKNAYHLNYSD